MEEDKKAEPHNIKDDEPQGLYSAEDEDLFGGLVSHSSRSGAVDVLAPLPLDAAAAYTRGVFGDGADREFELPAGGSDLGVFSVDAFAPTERSSDSVRAAGLATEFDLPGKPVYRSFGHEGDVMAMRRPNAGLDAPLEPFVIGDKPVEVAVEPRPQLATAVQPPPPPRESADGNLAVPALPPYYRLETYTHAKLVLGTDRAAVGAAIDTIGEALRAQHVDLEFKAEKCKWKCCFFLNTACVFFQVRLWKSEASPRAGEHVLEFQRRHGDGGPFMGFWRSTLSALGVSGPAPRGGTPALTRASTPTSLPMPSLGVAPSLLAPPPALTSASMPMPAQLLPTGPGAGLPLAGAPSEDDMVSVVNPLKEMVESGLPDAALAGARGLAQLSACKDHRMVMKQCNVVEALVKFMALAHKPFECLYFASAQIFAVACLANLSEEPVVQSSLYRSCGLLLDQVDNGCWRDRAMRREAARTLRNLAQDDQGTDSIIRQVGKERLQQWCQDTYPQLSDQSIISDAGIVSDRIRSRWAVCV